MLGDAGPAAWRGTVAARELSFGFGLTAALAGRFSIDRLAASGVDVQLVADPAAPAEPFRASSASLPLVWLLDSAFTRQVDLDDVTVTPSDEPSGQGALVSIETLRSREAGTSGSRAITATGAVNDMPVQLTADFAAAGGDDRRPFTVEAALPGAEASAAGVLGARGETLEGRLEADVAAMATLLDAFGIGPRLDGTLGLEAEIAGEIDALAVERLAVRGRLASGERLSLDGRIAELSTLGGIDLDVTASFARHDGSFWRPADAFDLEIERAQGRVVGSSAALSVADLVVETNLQAVGATRIGPIAVERVELDEAGRLGLSGLTVQVLEEGRASLTLAGRIDDALTVSGVALTGRLDVDPLTLIEGLPSTAGFGRFVGSFALSDRSGRLGLDELSARLTGDGPLALRLEKAAVAAPGGPEPVELTVEISDLQALARQLEAPVGRGGSASFKGDLSIEDGLRLLGRGTIGRSPLWLDLSHDVVDDRIELRGAVKSPRLRLADVPRIAALVDLWPRDREPDAPGETAASSVLDVELEADAAIVDGDDYRIGGFNGRFALRDGVVLLRPLRLDYLGGRADAELRIDLAKNPPPVGIEASIRELEIDSLLRGLGARALVDAPLRAELDLTAAGTDRRSIMRTLSGQVELAVDEGRIGSRLIDLTAQDIVGWLFARGADTRLVCAASLIAFAAGNGTVEGLVLKTDNIQLIGTGSIDLHNETLDLAFAPRPRANRLLRRGTPFTVQGPLDGPSVAVGSAIGVARRAVIETLTLPLSVLGALVPGDAASVLSTCEIER